ncbi:hypothetical protein WJX72_003659 [[Myrmecia] bisecta]
MAATQPSSSSSLPRVLEIQKFAAAREQEIRALCETIKAPDSQTPWGAAALPRHLRRRATSHNSYKHRRRPNTKLAEKRQRLADETTAAAELGCEGEAPALNNRAMRRRPGRMQQSVVDSCAGEPGLREALRARRLETHVWHAKRMEMKERWGHVLAEGAVGKGLGSRAFLAALKTGTVLHDASYWCPLELAGSQDDLVAVLGQ